MAPESFDLNRAFLPAGDQPPLAFLRFLVGVFGDRGFDRHRLGSLLVVLNEIFDRKGERLRELGIFEKGRCRDRVTVLIMGESRPDGLNFRLAIEVLYLEVLTLGHSLGTSREIFADTLTIERARKPSDFLAAWVGEL